ncbi:hypothetical protein H0H92_008679 [Tricholoma furcatifolium]|nr:hypothetical protein H0H92_008679 [Tricholoma furcatifolium]
MTSQNLFPPPSTTRSKLAPRTWPGITPESTEITRRLIQDSQNKWHLFFLRDYRPHNHSVHHALALWALGADHEIIQAAYEHDTSYLLAKFDSPEKITDRNFLQHLGDDDAYLDYFIEIVQKLGPSEAVEKYLFARTANFIAGKKDEEQPEMLNRAMDGVIHSFIAVGYGLEFNIPGLVAEGLAWTAVHFKSSSAVMPVSLWEVVNPSRMASLTRRLQSIDFGRTGSKPGQSNVHALTILARILKDTRFDKIPPEELYTAVYSNITNQVSLCDAINEYVRSWTFDRSNPSEAERKIEELVYANTVIYAIAGWSKDEHFNADFFFILKPASQEILLRSYLSVCLTWWIGRCRPGFDVEGFFAVTSLNTGPVTDAPPFHKDALPKADSPKAGNPNPWLQLMQDVLILPDEHLPKALRALSHFSEIYGDRTAGKEDFAATELPGAELIDGTLFIRAAILTCSRMRREKDVDVDSLIGTAYWERKGFYKA